MENKVLIGIIFVTCLMWQVNAAVNCTETGAGRFTDGTDTTCQNYTLCVYSSTTGTYTSYDYTCPTTSVFNPNTQLCTDPANYTCNVTTTNSTDSTDNSTSCTADGYFADPSSTDCSTYIGCVSINSTFIETTYTCPNETYFNPNTTLCEADYNCTSTDSTEFTCTAAGRFADSSDTTCQTYYYCVLTSTGTYTMYTYTCPSTSVFNPNTAQCTSPTNYTCTN